MFSTASCSLLIRGELHLSSELVFSIPNLRDVCIKEVGIEGRIRIFGTCCAIGETRKTFSVNQSYDSFCKTSTLNQLSLCLRNFNHRWRNWVNYLPAKGTSVDIAIPVAKAKGKSP